jgi:hypothetical protein
LRKREEKEEVKRITRAAKGHRRANRDEDMDFFATYYKEKYLQMNYKDFKNDLNHPKRIVDMI